VVTLDCASPNDWESFRSTNTQKTQKGELFCTEEIWGHWCIQVVTYKWHKMMDTCSLGLELAWLKCSTVATELEVREGFWWKVEIRLLREDWELGCGLREETVLVNLLIRSSELLGKRPADMSSGFSPLPHACRGCFFTGRYDLTQMFLPLYVLFWP
jgi:hypothetical protein